MLRVIGCLTGQHDIYLLACAVAIGAVTSFATMVLLGRAEAAEGGCRWNWSGLAGAVAGGGIWATHFVGMLAFDPGLPSAFDPRLTLGSAVIAVGMAILGIAVCILQPSARGRAMGGGVVGTGIYTMHILGVAALRVPGHLAYDGDLLAASAILGIGLFALAFAATIHPNKSRRTIAALIFAAAICSLHFVAMGAIVIIPDGTIAIPRAAIGRDWLAVMVASITITAITGTMLAIALEARRALAFRSAEAHRLRDLTEASFEGIAICADASLADANECFVALLGLGRGATVGVSVASILLPDGSAGVTDTAHLIERATTAPVTALLASAGGAFPVEVRARAIDTANGCRTVIAVRDLRERLASEARISYLAHHDALTGLANRTLLRDRLDDALARAKRTETTVAVLYMDLDRFKAVNDLHGHGAGDNLLREVAARLRRILRETDTAARLGGDEFVAVVPIEDGDILQSVEQVATRITSALGDPYTIDGIEASVSASVGIALYPQDGVSGDALLSNADTALYRTKGAGRNGFTFFSAEMDDEIRVRQALEQELRMALNKGEFSLDYQPQADAATGTVTGFEALIRWNRAGRGRMAPDVFVPIAESTGVIVPIGAWVLHQACAEAASWTVPLRIAVNVSPVQIQHGDLAANVASALATSGLDPSRLEIEVTESLLLHDTAASLAVLRRIKDMGVRIAMDDFGTGYSSLSTLRAFPFDKIKLDRAFIRDLPDGGDAAAIVKAVLGLGRGLGLPVVAEGVETEAQLAALRAENCAEIQGYLIGRPMPIGAFSRLTALAA